MPEEVPHPDHGAPRFGPAWPGALTVDRELARDERKGIRRLVTGWCANYDSGEDICLPLDPVLEKAVCEEGPPPDTKPCAVCGKPFLPEGRQAYCSPACKDEGNRRRSRERMRKKRAKLGQGRYDLGLPGVRDSKGF